MKTLKITKVRRILKDANGNALNIFVLDTPNRPSIVRSAKEFLTDLQGSYLIGENVNHPNHPELLHVLRDLATAPFTVSGEITDAKKGDTWTVTKNSRVVKDKTHPKFGQVQAGDEMPYEKDMTLVTDGFLNVALNATVNLQNKIAFSTGMAKASMMDTYDDIVEDDGVYGGNSTDNTVDPSDAFDPSDIPSDAFEDATEPATEPATEDATTE